jgi:hypothetical protein
MIHLLFVFVIIVLYCRIIFKIIRVLSITIEELGDVPSFSLGFTTGQEIKSNHCALHIKKWLIKSLFTSIYFELGVEIGPNKSLLGPVFSNEFELYQMFY